MKRIKNILYDRSPYDGLDLSQWPDDLQGWGSDHPWLIHAIDRIRPTAILEIGSWKGRSAINMAQRVKELDLDCEIVCVDTWLGSSEHWMRVGPGWYESLNLRHGFPSLYYTFLSNVSRFGLENIITPFPNTSETATYMFERLGIYFDLCYVDAAHEL